MSALSFDTQGSRFWKIAAVLLGTVSLFRGIRLPNTWSATFALVNYDQGFVKRGLLGATLGRALHLEHYAAFCVFSYAVLALLFVGVAALAWQGRVFDRVGSGEAVAIFAASPAVLYLGHLVGYLDIILASLTVGLLLLRKPVLRCAVSLPVCVVCLLIHEMFLFTFLPVLLFSFSVDAEIASSSQLRRRGWMMCAALACLSGVVALRLAAHASLTPAQVAEMTRAALARADYPAKAIVFTAFQLSGGDNVHIMRTLFLHDHRYTFLWLVSLATFALFAVPLLLASSRAVRALTAGKNSRVLLTFAFVASLSPLLMNLLGFDNVRWNALACLTSLLVLLVLARALPHGAATLPHWYRSATILLLAIGMASGEGLMDEKEPHAFPFVNSTMHLIHATMDSHRVPPPEH